MLRLLFALLTLFTGSATAFAQSDQDWMRPFLDNRPRQNAPRNPYPDSPFLMRPQYQEPRIVEPRFDAPREAMPEDVSYPGNLILVLRGSQQYSAYVNGRMAMFKQPDGVSIMLRGPVSTGTPGRYATPLTDLQKGAHSIEYKQVDYVSNTYPEPYGGAQMPYAMFFDRRGGFALHAGYVPRWDGRPSGASHGCVRLNPQHAKILYEHFSNETVRVIVVENMAMFHEKWAERTVGAL